MSVITIASSPSGLFNEDVRSQIHTAIDQMLIAHEKEIETSVAESVSHKLPVNFTLEVDCSTSEPKLKVLLAFTPKTVKDNRTIKCVSGDQKEFEIYTPSQIAALEKQLKADRAHKKAEEKAAAAASGGSVDPADGDPVDGAPVDGAPAPAKRGRKKKDKGDDDEDPANP